MQTGYILMNLGTPDDTSVSSVRRYLDEFLMDKRVIDKPYLLRLFLVKGIITRFRAPKSAEAYRSIWWKDGSPLMVLSEQLLEKVRPLLDGPVELAMRYGNPSPEAAYKRLLKQNPMLKEVVVLPLYPHYAMSSYETGVEYMKEVHAKRGYNFRLSFVPPFYNEPGFISALAESLKPYVQKDYDHVLFSYHGIPERHVIKTDCTGNHCLQSDDCCSTPSAAHAFCYRHQVFETTELVAKELALPSYKYSNSFQSRLGRDKWLEPFTVNRLKALPAEGVKKLIVLCPAFVTDCLETLEEMGKEGKHIFMEHGGESFELVPCLNTQESWVEAVVKYFKTAEKVMDSRLA